MITRNFVYMIILYILYFSQYVVIPAVVLYPNVKNKSFGYRFLLYQISGITYVNLVSYALSFSGTYNIFSTWICFVLLPILYRIIRSFSAIKDAFHRFGEVIHDNRSCKKGFRLRFRTYRKHFHPFFSFVYQRYLRGRLLLYAAAGIVLYFIIVKFGYFHLTKYVYSCSDEATHIYWINSLIHGKPFPVGLYPFGEHFMIGGFCAMFHLEVARAWMSFGVVYLAIIFSAAALLAEKIFGSKFAPAAGLLVFILTDMFSASWTDRLISVMPMELAMLAVFTMTYGLICWLEDKETLSLAMVGMGILCSTFLHVFSTVFAFFIVAAFVLIFGISMIRQKIFHKLLICGILAIVLAVVPYGVGLACGYELNSSFEWGMSVVSSGEDEDSASETESIESGLETENSDQISSDSQTNDSEDTSKKQSISLAALIQKFRYFVPTVLSSMPDRFTVNVDGALFLFGLLGLSFLYGLISLLFSRHRPDRRRRSLSIIYIAVAWSIAFIFCYAFVVMDIFTIMVTQRSCVFLGIFSIIFFAAPFQIIYNVIKFVLRKVNVENWLIILCGIGSIVYSVFFIDCLYSAFDYTFTLEDLDFKTEEYLINNKEKDTWTIISTTNARLAILFDGYHEEITDLLLSVSNKERFYISTPDIYVVVEKEVPTYRGYLVDGSDYDEYLQDISAEAATYNVKDFILYSGGELDSDTYLNDETRLGVMSHLYYWMEAMKDVYPDEISVFAEDKNCIVYHISQDPYFLLNLSLNYVGLAEADAETE